MRPDPSEASTVRKMDERRLRLLSVVVPLRDEEGAVGELHRRVDAALAGGAVELILVDDASGAGPAQLLASLAESAPRGRVLPLSRGFGHQAALTAGLEHARGDAAAMLDGDLQDPPELLPQMIAHWRSGSDVVSAVRTERAGESRVKLTTARWFYRLFEALGPRPDPGRGRLPAARPARPRRSALDAGAHPLPPGHGRWGRLPAALGAIRARRPPRRRDEVHAAQDAALLARRDHLVLLAAAAARDRARLPAL